MTPLVTKKRTGTSPSFSIVGGSEPYRKRDQVHWSGDVCKELM